jgi:hypothetical protein
MNEPQSPLFLGLSRWSLILGLAVFVCVVPAKAQQQAIGTQTQPAQNAQPALSDVLSFTQHGLAISDLGSAAREYLKKHGLTANTTTTVTAAQATLNGVSLSANAVHSFNVLEGAWNWFTLSTVAPGTDPTSGGSNMVFLMQPTAGKTYLMDASVATNYTPSNQVPCQFSIEIFPPGETQTITCTTPAPNTPNANAAQHLLFGVTAQNSNLMEFYLQNVYQPGQTWIFYGLTVTQINN